MIKLPVRLFQTVDGAIIRSVFGPEVDVIAAMEVRGFAFLGPNRNHRHRAELQGAPKFRGLAGPMWDGDAIRYEDPTTHTTLST